MVVQTYFSNDADAAADAVFTSWAALNETLRVRYNYAFFD